MYFASTGKIIAQDREQPMTRIPCCPELLPGNHCDLFSLKHILYNELIMAGSQISSPLSCTNTNCADKHTTVFQVAEHSIPLAERNMQLKQEKLPVYKKQAAEKSIEQISFDAEFSLPSGFFEKDFLDNCDTSEMNAKKDRAGQNSVGISG